MEGSQRQEAVSGGQVPFPVSAPPSPPGAHPGPSGSPFKSGISLQYMCFLCIGGEGAGMKGRVQCGRVGNSKIGR